MKKFAVGLLAGVMFSTLANAQSKEDITKIEDYLNGMKTLSAHFLQMASNGSSSEGELLIAKPNKIRMSYAEPTDVLIVGNGDYIVYNDRELDQVTNIDYEDVPASLLLANNLKIDGKELKVVDFEKDAGMTSVTVEYEKGNTGPITLVFSNQPFELKQWKVVDPQNIEISISLYNSIFDEPIDEKKFKFKRNEDKKKNDSNRKK